MRSVLAALALSLLAGCATNEPQYQIGLAGSRQTRSEAERTHAAGSPQSAPTADVDSPARVLSSPFPGYPMHLRRAGIEGRVVVRFNVETNGSVSDAVVQGSPPPELAALTLDAIRQWTFAPATKNGVPVRSRLAQPFVFQTE